MLNYAIFTQIKQRLLDITALTPKLLQGSGSFSAACVVYLNDFLKFGELHNLYFSSDISLTINKLLNYQPEKSQVAASTRHNARKDKDAFAAACLNDLHAIIKRFIEKDFNTFEECENIWRQVLSRILAKGYGETINESNGKLETIIALVKADNEFLPYYSHILGLVGIYNAKAVLDITLPQLGVN